MKAKLYKVLDQYHLYDGDKAIATTIVGNPMLLPNLSKQNCDEIFGIYSPSELSKVLVEGERGAFEFGYCLAREHNKDKVFTLEDMMNCWNKALKFQEHKQTFGEYIQSLQQPTEIEVEIVCMTAMNTEHSTNTGIPKLDSSENLILKKI
jgi:hypothetical protein